MKPTKTAKTTRQAVGTKKRRKAPICSELITSTDFSSDENQPEPAQQQPTTAPPAVDVQQRESADSSSGESGTSDSCTIASLIRATKADEQPEKQNTSSSSCSSSSSSSSSTSNSSGHSEPSNQLVPDHEPVDEEEEEDGDEGEEEDEEEGEDENNQSLGSTGGEEVDVSVAQVIAVGAEVEL